MMEERNFHSRLEKLEIYVNEESSLANASQRHMLPHPKQINAQFIVSPDKKLWENHKILTLCVAPLCTFGREREATKCGEKMET